MSKISVTTIAGLTSGGDANTVKIESGDAFNVVSGATTLGGDLAVNTNKLFVDASTDYIGMGTTSPATATGGGIDIHRNGGSSVRIDDTTNSVTGELQVYSAGLNLATVTNHNLILSTNNSAKMTIDGTGRVTVPNMPSFMARNHGQVANNANYIAAGVTMICYTIDHNIGSCYSTSNGRFTAPVAGRYAFGYSIGVVRINDNQTLYPYFTKNGTQIHYQYYQNQTTGGLMYAPISATIIHDLAAGDYLNVTIAGSGDWYAGLQETIMYGYLIG